MLLLGAAPGSHRCYALPTVALPRCRTAAAPLPHRHRGQRPLLLGLDAHRTHIAHIFGACGGVQIGFDFGGNLSGYSCVQNRCSVSSLTRSPTGGAEHLRRSRCLSVSRDSPHSQKRTPTRCPQSLRLAAFSFDSVQFRIFLNTNETSCDGNATRRHSSRITRITETE